MRQSCCVLLFLLWLLPGRGPVAQADLELTSTSSSEIPALADLLDFEDIYYEVLHFSGAKLPDKSFRILVREYWNGDLRADSILFDSGNIGIASLAKVNDTLLTCRVLAKQMDNNRLKISF